MPTLNESRIRAAKPAEKPYKLFDERGLFILLTHKRGAPFRLSEEQRKRFKNMSDAEIETLALTDPENPPVSAEQLKWMVLAREVWLVREKTVG